MSLPGFISRRIIRTASGFASVIHRIAVASLAIGLAAMIVSFLIMDGFRNTVRDKIYSFSGHLIINRISGNNSAEEVPFSLDINLINHPDSFPMVSAVQEFSHKAGLIKSGDEILGIMLKGVGRSFDSIRFVPNMKTGRFLHRPDSGYSREVVISQLIADKLQLNVNDEVVMHFFQNPPRSRKVRISGIYETNLADYFDEKIILCDIGLIRRLNDWEVTEAGGLQVYLNDPMQADAAYNRLMDALPFDLYVEKTSDRYIQVFEWLNLLSRQVNILLVIILAVVCVNMISVVLILVMERTPMIGMLKALGAGDALVRRIFYAQGIRLILRGLLWGNLVGLGLCALQHYFRLVRLDPHSYYMDYVPVAWSWDVVILLNLLMFAVVFIVLMLPVMLITRVRPVSAIRFD